MVHFVVMVFFNYLQSNAMIIIMSMVMDVLQLAFNNPSFSALADRVGFQHAVSSTLLQFAEMEHLMLFPKNVMMVISTMGTVAAKTVKSREDTAVVGQYVLDFVVMLSMTLMNSVMMEILSQMMDAAALALSKSAILVRFPLVSFIQYVLTAALIEIISLNSANSVMTEMQTMGMDAVLPAKLRMTSFVYIMCLEINPPVQ